MDYFDYDDFADIDIEHLLEQSREIEEQLLENRLLRIDEQLEKRERLHEDIIDELESKKGWYIERLETKGHEAVDDLIAGIDATDLDVREAVVRGYAPEVIAEYVDDNDVDLVVMSSEGQSNLAGQQLGTVAGRVLRTVDRPVLVVTED